MFNRCVVYLNAAGGCCVVDWIVFNRGVVYFIAELVVLWLLCESIGEVMFIFESFQCLSSVIPGVPQYSHHTSRQASPRSHTPRPTHTNTHTCKGTDTHTDTLNYAGQDMSEKKGCYSISHTKQCPHTGK